MPRGSRCAWVILSVIGVIIALQIHIPPGDQSIQGEDQSRTLTLLTAIATPIFIGIVMMLIYSAVVFRRRGPELVDGPPMLGNTPIQITWIVGSTILVVFLAVVGIATLASSNVAQAVGASGYRSLRRKYGHRLPARHGATPAPPSAGCPCRNQPQQFCSCL